MGILLTTVKKSVRRYRAEGAAGLLDRSSRLGSVVVGVKRFANSLRPSSVSA